MTKKELAENIERVKIELEEEIDRVTEKYKSVLYDLVDEFGEYLEENNVDL